MAYMDGRTNVCHIMPLKKTSVDAHVAGFGARVTVTQRFSNPSNVPIEAVYTFPLPHDSAVDQMTMQVGNRVIEGEIKKREEARAIYDEARNAGQTAALLDEENSNIFTQSVANIMPGQEVQVKISYVQLLKFEKGEFEFSFPMVVGPRFLGVGTPNPDKISPPMAAFGTRTGQNIELKVDISAGAPIKEVGSVLHAVKMTHIDEDHVQVALSRKDEIPNRDFILRYRTATDTVKSALLTTYQGEKGGFFSLILLPPAEPKPEQIAPKEMIFVVDQSGSQSGFPIDKSKELTLKLMKKMNPGDTFNVMGFSNDVNPLWQSAQPNTAANQAAATAFVNSLQANGGTQLEKAVVAALASPSDPERVRIVLFNTDGFAGQEPVILQSVKRFRGNSRLFTFGIGNSVNRGLIDAMSTEGRGDTEVVTLAESADAAVDRLVQRTSNPVLTNVEAKFEGVQVSDAQPRNLPDVFSEKPVVIFGRYTNPGKGKVTITGRYAGKPWSQTIELNLPAGEGDGSSVAALWARSRIGELGRLAYESQSEGKIVDPKREITKVALDYGLMSPYTSFVAVEKRVVNVGGHVRTVRVPVEVPDGMSAEGVGQPTLGTRFSSSGTNGTTLGLAKSGGGRGGGGGGYGGGVGGLSASAAQNKNQSLFGMGEGLYRKPEGAFVPDSLLKAKGKVEIQISVSAVSSENLKKLKDLGVKIEDSDKGLKVIFASCDATILKKIAALQFVQRIDPL